MPSFKSKLPDVGTTIFTVMSTLARNHGAINLGQGFPNFDAPDDLKGLIAKYLKDGLNQYAPMSGVPALNSSIAQKVNRAYGLRLDPVKNVTVTAGATQALFTALAALVSEGEEVILIEPAYDSYRPAIRLAGGLPVPYVLKAPEYRVDWNEIEDMITSRTRMIIINTPHNPIGKVFSKSDLESLEQIVKANDVFVLSDEVYEHLIYDQRKHQSVCLFPDLFERSIAVYSFGKTFHATGWKIGYALGPDHLMAEFRKVHQFNVFSVNSFIQHALADYLLLPESYEYLPSFFQKKRDLMESELKTSPLRPLECEGTYFQLYDYGAISDLDDLAFCKLLTTKYGVAAIPVSVFYSSGRQDAVIRLCFAKTDDVLIQAAQKLQALQSWS